MARMPEPRNETEAQAALPILDAKIAKLEGDQAALTQKIKEMQRRKRSQYQELCAVKKRRRELLERWPKLKPMTQGKLAV